MFAWRCLVPLSTISLSYIVAVSFIGGGNRRTRRKPHTCRKSLTNFNTCCTPRLSPLMLWVRLLLRARLTTLCDTVCQWLATTRWFSPCLPVSSTNKTDRHDITEILLKVALNTIKLIIILSKTNTPSQEFFLSDISNL